jgi:glycosyltransferase involved in cell wall biosynthesis
MRDGVSVVIPVYNGARYLSDCIRSVLAQTEPPAEIIVIDDGSEDDTPQVAAEWSAHVRYERRGHGGISFARNEGLKLVTTEYIAFIDSDDLWLPRKLEWQLAALRGEAGPAMAFGQVEQFISEDVPVEKAAKLRIPAEAQPGFYASALLTRHRDWVRVGAFDETIGIGEFIDWYARAKDAGLKPIVLPEVVCRRRVHANNTMRREAHRKSEYARTLKKVLDRRRGTSDGSG